MNWRETADRTLALTGVAVAICAAVITFYQVHLMRTQAKIAVWPHVEQYDSFPLGTPHRFMEVVRNAGLGPAVIRWVDISVDGRSMHSAWQAVARRLTGIQSPAVVPTVTSDLPSGFVLLPGQKVVMLEIDGSDANAAEAGRSKFDATICYCSLYGDCWESRSSTALNERVKNCPNARTSGFYAGGNTPSKPPAPLTDLKPKPPTGP